MDSQAVVAIGFKIAFRDEANRIIATDAEPSDHPATCKQEEEEAARKMRSSR